MKKILLAIALVLVCQSCFTYKETNNRPNSMILGKTYKIYHNHTFSKVIFKNIKDSNAIVLKGRKEQQIPLKDIAAIEKRKFSIVKTTVLLLPLVAILSYIADPEINVGAGNSPN